MSGARMSASERRQALIDAALKVFADVEVDRVTMKQVADAAGVSEALLYKHFDSKQTLYQQVLMHCAHAEGQGHEGIPSIPPSTSSLVIGMHWLIERVLLGGERGQHYHEAIRRLMLRSALSEGEFIRQFNANKTERMVQKLEQCLLAAEQAGDVSPRPQGESARLRIWLAYDTAIGAAAFRLEPPLIDYGVPYEKLVPHIVRFALRGMGLTSERIDALYNPTALAVLGSASPP